MRNSKPTLLLIALGLAVSPLCAAAAPISTELPLNATLRAYGGADEGPRRFRLELPGPGIVTVDLATAGPERLSAWIDLCRDLPEAGATILEQSATHLALAVRAPRTVCLRAAAEDPRRPLGSYKLTTSFVAAEVADETFAFGDSGTVVTRTRYLATSTAWKADPEPVDPDPDGLSGSGALLASLLSLPPAAAKADPEPVDPDPDGLRWEAPTTGAGLSQVLFYRPACVLQSGEVDDHGDTASCATPLALGHRVAGEIGNRWGDDGDVFAFTLSELTTVEITTRGDTDTFGELSGRSGHRLAVDDDGADDGPGNFRIATTLAPGRYSLRVTGGTGAEGAYELVVTARDR
ncbi:MAG: hypothetical protein V3T72_21135 [Thermoanaerobaculia bacterium]